MNLGNRRAEKEPDKKEDLIKARMGTYFQRYNKYTRKAKRKYKAFKTGQKYEDLSSVTSKSFLKTDAQFHPEFFKQQLEKIDISQFRFERYSLITDEIIQALK